MKNKYAKMIYIFLGVLLNKKEIITSIVPNNYKKNIKEVDYDKLWNENKKYLIFDIDNTITKVDDITIDKETIKLFKTLKEKDFNILLMSNNSEKRVIPISEKLNVPYLANAKKPNKEAFDKVLSTFDCLKENVVMIGDQMLSDIVGANEYGIYSILVDPVSKKNNIQTGMAKLLQDIMVKKIGKKKIFQYKKYY